MYAPVILFTYNRLHQSKEVIKSLQLNDLASETDLLIYSDGPKNNNIDIFKVDAVRKFINDVSGFKSIQIIEKEVNIGLFDMVTRGVSEVIKKYHKVIVLEDDIVTSPKFLTYMNEALLRFEPDNEIMSISGYTYPISLDHKYQHDLILSHRTSSWGWATWKDRWESVDFDVDSVKKYYKNYIKTFSRAGPDLPSMIKARFREKNKSWAIFFALSHHIQNKYAIMPSKSFCQNIGHDGSGEHCHESTKWLVKMSNKDIKKWDKPFLDESIVYKIQELHKISFREKALTKVKRLFS
jgi:hypothetical protein